MCPPNYLLGRTLDREGTTIAAEDLYDSSAEKGNVLRGPIIAMLQKKLVVNTTSMLFDLLGKVGNKEAIQEAAAYLGGALFKLYRQLYRAGQRKNTWRWTAAPLTPARWTLTFTCRSQVCRGAGRSRQRRRIFPRSGPRRHDAAYPGVHQSALQVFHAASERVNTSLGKK